MDISGLVQSYDSRAASSAALSLAIMGPNYMPIHAFNGAPSNNMAVAHLQMLQNNLFSFAPYTGAGQNGIIPAYANNYIQQQPLPRLTQPNTSYARNARQSSIAEHHSQSPPNQSEPQWSGRINSPSFLSTNTKTTAITPARGSNEVNFGTEVDTLMKAIQAKTQSTTLQKLDIQEEASPKGGKKRYQCTFEHCPKSFYQKKYVKIHERSHAEIKPYVSNLLPLSKSGL
jgi:hypothetical protein